MVRVGLGECLAELDPYCGNYTLVSAWEDLVSAWEDLVSACGNYTLDLVRLYFLSHVALFEFMSILDVTIHFSNDISTRLSMFPISHINSSA